MNIINFSKKAVSSVKFRELGIGDAFLHDNCLHLKTKDTEAFNMKDNTAINLPLELDVEQKHLNVTAVTNRRPRKKGVAVENQA